MKRYKVIGLCLVAVFAFSAIAASGAQAGTFGRCVKETTKPYKGKFTDKNCLVKATPAEEAEGKHNKYNWVPGPGPKPGFTSKGGASALKGEAGEITCKKNTDVGKMTGEKTDEDVFTFEKCVLSVTKESCQSYGDPAGTIKTYPNLTTIIDNGEKGLSGGEPKPGEVWQQFSWNGVMHTDPVFGPGPWLASFECSKIPFVVSGSVSGIMGVNINSMQKKSTLDVGVGKGEQDLVTTFFNPLTAKVESGPSSQTGSGKAKYEEKGEIQT